MTDFDLGYFWDRILRLAMIDVLSWVVSLGKLSYDNTIDLNP